MTQNIKIWLCLIVIICSCGVDEGMTDGDVTTMSEAGIENPTFDQFNEIMLVNCSGSTCHSGSGNQNPYVSNDELIEANSSLIVAEIEAGRMPKGSSLTEADRETLLNYLNSIDDPITDEAGSTDPSETVSESSPPSWAEYDAIAVATCSGSSCHSGTGGQNAYNGNSALVSANKVQIMNELEGGTMPKTGSISASDKQIMLDFLSAL